MSLVSLLQSPPPAKCYCRALVYVELPSPHLCGYPQTHGLGLGKSTSAKPQVPKCSVLAPLVSPDFFHAPLNQEK
jgi:hypothetical protein